jgi:hypothetical protein
MLTQALLYYAYSRLAHALLRSAIYDNYDGGEGVGPLLRRIFGIKRWNRCYSKLALVTNSRATELEKLLLRSIDQSPKSFNVQKYVPVLLTLSVVADQHDRHFQQGQWLMYPEINLMVSKQSPKICLLTLVVPYRSRRVK